MYIIEHLKLNSIKAINKIYNIKEKNLYVNKTIKNFNGDYTIFLFSIYSKINDNTYNIAYKIGNYIKCNYNIIDKFEIINGFLNVTIKNEYLLSLFIKLLTVNKYKKLPFNNKTVIIEYLSPNTNKPLHLGHLRNAFLGNAISNILSFIGYKVIKVILINDRGIHICKSMLAWQKFGNNQTPYSTKIKGDHFVGKYYVKYNEEYQKQVKLLLDNKSVTPIEKELSYMLKKWENQNLKIINIWNKMNNWFYEGFNKTCIKLDINFDKEYFESNLYKIGKKSVFDALQKGLVFKKKDNSIWIDLSQYGLDEKLLLRSDGTSVYITQDIAASKIRFTKDIFKSLYIVGNEQEYHFKVLKKILQIFGEQSEIEHLSYGMVYLPDGKMKSREGNIIDADNIIELLIEKSRKYIINLNKSINDKEIYSKIGIGAIKYFFLKIDPKKDIVFKIDKSINLNGNTATFIQYTYARIISILYKACKHNVNDYFIKKSQVINIKLTIEERNLIIFICEFEDCIISAGKLYNPSLITNYLYELSKKYNIFYNNCIILNNTTYNIKLFRITISYLVAKVILQGMTILGIKMPYNM